MTHQQEVADRIAQLRREKSARERRDVLQKEIAEAVGISTVTYSRYENGERKIPEEVIQALAAYFGTTAPFLRYGVTTAAPSAPPDLHGEPRLEDVEGARARNQAKRNAALPPAAGDRPGPTRRPKPR